MESLKRVFGIIITTFLLCSCSNNSPKTYFDKAALNSNLVTAYYTPKFFGEIMELKSKNRLTVVREKAQKSSTATEYLKDRLPDLSKNISEIKSLKKTDETKEMLDASIDYFKHADKIFKNDYPKIAKMIDEDLPQAEIDASIKKIFENTNRQMSEKYNRLWKAAEVYADKNNIPLLKH